MTDDSQQEGHKSFLDKLSQTFSAQPQTKAELMGLLRDAIKRGLLNEHAFSMIEGVMNVSQMQVRDIMIPRAQIAVVRHDQDYNAILATVVAASHSRFPVIGENKDDVIGILLAKELLKHALTPKADFQLKDLLRPPYFVPESKRLDILLKEFRHSRNHMAVVIDEYGGIGGLVTIEDVLEEIVGNIEDEFDQPEYPSIEPINSLCYRVQAMTPVEDFNDYFATDFTDEQCDTIGGYLASQFGRLPEQNEQLTIDNLNFTVTKADKRRIITLEVQVIDGDS